MKRGNVFGLFFVSFVLIISFLSFVSAQEAVSGAINQFTSGVAQATKLLFGDFLQSYEQGQDVFYMKVLLFILIFVMVQTGVKAVPKLGEQKAVAFVVSFVVSVLGVKFMSDNLIKSVLLPYGGLAVALATLLPFLIFFYFVHATKMNGAGRRISWILFALSFGLVAFSNNRWSSLDTTGQYFYYAVGALIVIALVFDKGIHRYFFMHELNLFYRGAKGKAIAALQAEYLNIVNVDTPEAEKRRTDIENNLKRLGGNLP